MGAARRRSEGGHDRGWRLRLVTVANCEAVDRPIGSALARAAARLQGYPLPRLQGCPPPRMLCTLHTLSRVASVHAHALYPAGDVPEYNISTCILEGLANPTACNLWCPSRKRDHNSYTDRGAFHCDTTQIQETKIRVENQTETI